MRQISECPAYLRRQHRYFSITTWDVRRATFEVSRCAGRMSLGLFCSCVHRASLSIADENGKHKQCRDECTWVQRIADKYCKLNDLENIFPLRSAREMFAPLSSSRVSFTFARSRWAQQKITKRQKRKRVRDKDKKKSGTEEIAKRSLHRNKFSRDESESGIISSRHKDARTYR